MVDNIAPTNRSSSVLAEDSSERIAVGLDSDLGSEIIGYLERVDYNRIVGWVWNPLAPEAPITITVYDNESVMGRFVANVYRRDLEDAGMGNGRHGFDIKISPGLPPTSVHKIAIVCNDTTEINGSPQLLCMPSSFDEHLKASIQSTLSLASSVSEIDEMIYFYIEHLEALMNTRARFDGNAADRAEYTTLRRRLGIRQADEHYSHRDEPPTKKLRKRILFVDVEVPRYGRNAGAEAVLSHITAFLNKGFKVSFASMQDTRRDQYSDLINKNVEVFQPPFYCTTEEILKRQQSTFDLIYLHREVIAGKYLQLCRYYQPTAKIIFSVADLHFLRTHRQGVVEDRSDLLIESARLKVSEFTSAWLADAVITHSDYEADILRNSVNGVNVNVIQWAQEVQSTKIGACYRNDVAFVGNYAHQPNIDAVLHLVENIMPLVWLQLPNLKVRLIGTGVTKGIRALEGENVIVVGEVADLASALHQVRLTVAPLRYGAGVKGKILSSIAAGIPCVATAEAAEGLDDCGGIIVCASEAEPFSRALIDLYLNVPQCDVLAELGLEYVNTALSQERVDQQFQMMLDRF